MYLTAEIQQRADLRAKLAEQMSAFEASRGEIKTMPIIRRSTEGKRELTISTEESRMAKSRAIGRKKSETTQAAAVSARKAKQAQSDYGRNYLNKKKMLNEAWT